MGREHRFDGSVGSLGSDPFGLVGVLEAVGKAVAVDPAVESDETLMAAAVAVDVARSTLEAAEARILGRLEVSGATDAEVGMRTGGWLAWETDTNPTKCRQRVSTARRLGWFPVFTEALTEHRVGFCHGEVLASVANPRNRDGLREVQDVLIELAGRYRFREWSSLVHQLADDLDSDGSFDPNDDPDRNRLRLVDNRDGTMELKGHLNGTTAVTVTQGLEALADELFRRYSKDREADPDLAMPTRPRLLAEALAEALRRASAVKLDSTKQPTVEATIIIDQDPECDAFDDLDTMTERDGATRVMSRTSGAGTSPVGSSRRAPPRHCSSTRPYVACSSTVTECPCTSETRSGSPPPTRNSLSRSVTAAASSQDATCPPRGVTHTTNRHGNQTEAPTSTRCTSPVDATTESPIDAVGPANPTPTGPNNGPGPPHTAANYTANATAATRSRRGRL